MNDTLTTTLSGLILGIDHVAIAIEDLDTSASWYTAVLGFKLAERNTVSGAHSGMVYAVLTAGDSTIVLVQGTSPESQVSKFIREKGAGMHHIALAVRDLDEAVDRAKQAGSIPDTPIVADGGIRQAFLPRDAVTGIRIELIERHGTAFSMQNVRDLFVALEAQDLY